MRQRSPRARRKRRRTRKEGTKRLNRTQTKYHRDVPNQIPQRAKGERARHMANRGNVLAQKQEERSERRLHQKRKTASETARSTLNQHAVARNQKKGLQGKTPKRAGRQRVKGRTPEKARAVERTQGGTQDEETGHLK